MTPRRKDDDDLEAFDPEFDDDVFAAPAGDDEAEPPPRRKRARSGAKARPGSRSRAAADRSAAPVSRARRIGRVLGAVALAAVLVTFVVSFISGLGGGAGERVVGDAETGGYELDRMGPRLRVEVLNAGGVAGVARRATEHLRDRGFDVVAFGNAGISDRATTVVLARTTNVDNARAVAEALGADSVAVEPDPQLFLDVTVLLGSDWPPVAAAEPDADGGFLGWFRGAFD